MGVASWFRGASKESSRPASIIENGGARTRDEAADLTDAMAAASQIMNDDMDGADILLNEKDSPFHLLGRGVVQFMRALLGFEQDVMKLAFERLIAAENASWAEMKQAEKEKRCTSQIYPPGTEYALCYAESQLMSAMVAVLNENLTESLKGFYKLRKAFITLDGVMAIEDKYTTQMRGLGGASKASLVSQSSRPTAGAPGEVSRPPSILDSNATVKPEKNGIADDDSDLEFVDADESHSGVQTPAQYLGHLQLNEDSKSAGPSPSNLQTVTPSGYDTPNSAMNVTPGTPARRGNDAGNSDLFITPIDAFIHSGSNLCYGVLLLIISMVPPVFNRLLSIIGFKGDRERGLTLLWQSSGFPNFNGAVASLFLLGYYNGLTGFCDILPDNNKYPDDIMGFPRRRCEELLASMQQRYPKSLLWRIEEGRMLSSKKELRQSIAVLSQPNQSTMKQIVALNLFEKSLNCMYVHDYLECAKSFEGCMELNTWSHCLYTYIIACCQVELFRDARDAGNEEEATKWKKSAAHMLRDAPTHAGKKKFMAKQLPFDVFVTRKISKLEGRAKEWGCDIVDAIGVSPIEEMIYLWNGTKRMPNDQLLKSLSRLEWSQASLPEKHQNNLDETGMHSLLKSTVIRNLKRYDEARQILLDGVISHDKNAFKGPLKDDWACPAAYYEMAVISWYEKSLNDGADEKAKVADCEEWLLKVSNWEGYVLDTRVGIKITTAKDTLRRHKERML